MSDALVYVRPEKLYLKAHPHFNEAWLHKRIIEDPLMLGFGDVRVLDHERVHAGTGRLDLLLYDEDTNRRYEVEIMLGATDPSHVVRTIEYWDIERRRYPGYEHVAVLIAEDITSRFLNVLSLLSGSIPFVAIQLSALQVGNQIGLHFVKVLDQTELRIDDEVETGGDVVTRAHWESKVGAPLMAICDEVLELVNKFATTKREYSFLQQYIGLRANGVVDNFVAFRPKGQKKIVQVTMRTSSAPQVHEQLAESGLNSKLLPNGRFVRLLLDAESITAHRDAVAKAIAETIHDNNA